MTASTLARQAAALIAAADGLLVTAGAGMGVDSGLPDFRGAEGFWQAYPALGRSRIRFEDVANPATFRTDARLAWGFYGHRLRLYRDTVPHAGYALLLEIGQRLEHGVSVFTSNVDGQFQKAGFPEEWIVECHGSIHHLQCVEDCAEAIWSARALDPAVDADTCRMDSALPKCPQCGGLARPNILMFGDFEWNASRTHQQRTMFNEWLHELRRPVVIELGAGTAIPTVRRFGEQLACPLIRVNLREPDLGDAEGISMRAGTLDALQAIAQALGS